MELILRELKKKRVSAKYKQQYFKDGVWLYDSSATFDKLVALGSDPDADKIDEIMGNKSWTHTLCDECSKYCADAISAGGTALCADCLKLFIRALEKETK